MLKTVQLIYRCKKRNPTTIKPERHKCCYEKKHSSVEAKQRKDIISEHHIKFPLYNDTRSAEAKVFTEHCSYRNNLSCNNGRCRQDHNTLTQINDSYIKKTSVFTGNKAKKNLKPEA